MSVIKKNGQIIQSLSLDEESAKILDQLKSDLNLNYSATIRTLLKQWASLFPETTKMAST